MIGLAVVGAAGRMGRLLVQLAAREPGWRVVGALERAGHPQLGQDVGVIAGGQALGVELVASAHRALAAAEVVVDFAAPPAVDSALPVCAARKLPLLVAATALGPAEQAALDEAATQIPLLAAANLSLGVHVLGALARQAAALLAGKGFDLELVETHHRRKRDAPSGTALSLARALVEAGAVDSVLHGRAGQPGARQPGTLGVASLRGGEVIGEHTLLFLGDHERLELTHRATSPEIFPAGALAVARWLREQPPGRYGMEHFFARP